MAAGSVITHGASFTYETGRTAALRRRWRGGIDVSGSHAGRNPRRAERIRAAALAPTDLSAQGIGRWPARPTGWRWRLGWRCRPPSLRAIAGNEISANASGPAASYAAIASASAGSGSRVDTYA